MFKISYFSSHWKLNQNKIVRQETQNTTKPASNPVVVERDELCEKMQAAGEWEKLKTFAGISGEGREKELEILKSLIPDTSLDDPAKGPGTPFYSEKVFEKVHRFLTRSVLPDCIRNQAALDTDQLIRKIVFSKSDPASSKRPEFNSYFKR